MEKKLNNNKFIGILAWPLTRVYYFPLPPPNTTPNHENNDNINFLSFNSN